jgi:Cupredoxin-like domain
MKRQPKRTFYCLTVLVTIAFAAAAYADNSTIGLRFENHRFAPERLAVPAGRSLVIKVENASRETIEFESFKLNREKVVQPGESIMVRLPALSPGTYEFYDDFHQDVPQGSIVAK